MSFDTFRLKTKETNPEDIALWITQENARVTLYTGAGISTSVGISDYRSKTGLINQLQDGTISNPRGFQYAEIMSSSTRDPDAEPECVDLFFRLGSVLQEQAQRAAPSETHNLAEFLARRNLLLKYVTSNVDCLEDKVDIPEPLIYRMHGSMKKWKCCNTIPALHNPKELGVQLDDMGFPCVPREDPCKKRMTDIKCPGEEKDSNERFCSYCKTHSRWPEVVLIGDKIDERTSIMIQEGATNGKTPKTILLVMGTSLSISTYPLRLLASAHQRVVYVDLRAEIPCDRMFSYACKSDLDTFSRALMEELSHYFPPHSRKIPCVE